MKIKLEMWIKALTCTCGSRAVPCKPLTCTCGFLRSTGGARAALVRHFCGSCRISVRFPCGASDLRKRSSCGPRAVLVRLPDFAPAVGGGF